jgi:hypothetical protein
MPELPVQTGQTVQVQQVPTGFSQAHITPEDQGAGIAKGLAQAGQVIGEIATQQRRLKADFDAVEADHEFVKQESAAWEDFKTKYKPNEYKDHLEEYQNSLEALLPKVAKERKLDDPLAQKAYHTMTRRRMDFRMAHATQFAGDQLEKWMDNSAIATTDHAIEQARNSPPPTIKTPEGGEVIDTRDMGTNMLQAAHERMERLGKQMPADKAAFIVHNDQVKIVEGALSGYLGNDDPAAMKKFLDAPIVGVNDANGIPMTPKRILGEKWKEWERKADRLHAEKKGDALGFATLAANNFDPVAAEKDLQGQLEKKSITQEEYRNSVDAVKHHSDLHQDLVNKQVASDERIAWRAINANGGSPVGAFNTPEERQAWQRLQDTDFPRRVRAGSEKDEARDMLVGARWTEWLANNHEKASKMNLDELLKVARSKEIGMTGPTEKYVVPSINRFMMEKNPLRKRGEAETIQVGQVEIWKGLGKEFDPARPELNKWQNWEDPVERKAYAMYMQRLTDWLGKWYADPANKDTQPSPEEFQKAMGPLLEKVEIPPGPDRPFLPWKPIQEPRIKQMARNLLRTGAGSGNTQDVKPGLPGTGVTPTPSPAPASPKKAEEEIPQADLKDIDDVLKENNKPITDENRRKLWKAMNGGK